MPERRSEARNAWKDQVVLQMSEGRFAEASARDINLLGVAVESDADLSTGEVIGILLRPHGVQTVVPVLAEVVWREPAGKCRRAGLRFLT